MHAPVPYPGGRDPPRAREEARRRGGPARPEEAERVSAHSGVARDQRKTELPFRNLYEIARQLARFESLERTLPSVLATASESVPLRSAVAVVADEDPGGVIVLHA